MNTIQFLSSLVRTVSTWLTASLFYSRCESTTKVVFALGTWLLLSWDWDGPTERRHENYRNGDRPAELVNVG
ncbi:hypothetical protein O3M35_006770 [Rhynocoris fuscipes]|uniref:Secreted protein n=1 Tax=Rhynocoris fuscipes TaxID=488301 RepID=A0AAW1DFG7_9HEMI